MVISGYPGLRREIVTARHTLLQRRARVLPIVQWIIVVGRKAQVLAPGFRAQTAAIKIGIQQAVIKGVVAQQPLSGDPALPQPQIPHQPIVLLCQAKLAPGEIMRIILQRHKPTAMAAGHLALAVHQQLNIGISPGR